MKAIVYERYGPPEMLHLREVDRPAPQPDEVLVRVHAASVNPLDWHELTGAPYLVRIQKGLRRPKSPRLGVDLAGRVEAVGSEVTLFQPGDEVFGVHSGAFAEYVCVREAGVLVRKPVSLTFVQAAAVPVAALTALQGLRDKGRIKPGQRVLINGASGGVGTFAVQIAKALGAHVTGVCSTKHVGLIRELGADGVIDYTQHDFTRDGQRYDLILDNVGTRTIADRKRALSPGGTLVLVSGPKKNRWLGPLAVTLRAMIVSRLGRARLVPMLTHPTKDDLATLRDLLGSGKVTPVIDRTFPLRDTAQALGYLGEGHARGKVIVTVGARSESSGGAGGGGAPYLAWLWL